MTNPFSPKNSYGSNEQSSETVGITEPVPAHMPYFGVMSAPVWVNEIRVGDIEFHTNPRETSVDVVKNQIESLIFCTAASYPVVTQSLMEEIFEDMLFKLGVLASNEKVASWEGIIEYHFRTSVDNRWCRLDVTQIETKEITVL